MFTIITQGTFVSTGLSQKIPLPSSADYFKTVNVTQMALTATPGVVIMSEWYADAFAANDGIRWKKTNATNALNADTFRTAVASDGFTYVTTYPSVEAQAANAITAITQADPAVVTQVNTYSEGDVIRVYGTTGMLQIAGMDFQISNVTGAGYSFIGLDAAAFAAPGTAGHTRRISNFNAVLPEYLYVTSISQASQAVVRTSIDPSLVYVVGMKVHFSVPYSFGMTQMNQLTGKVLAVDSTTYELTVDIDSSAFTAFAFPASASSPTAQLFATIAPAGASTQYDPITGVQTGYDFNKQPFRTSQFVPYMNLGGGAQSPAGAADDVIVWVAYKKEN